MVTVSDCQSQIQLCNGRFPGELLVAPGFLNSRADND